MALFRCRTARAFEYLRGVRSAGAIGEELVTRSRRIAAGPNASRAAPRRVLGVARRGEPCALNALVWHASLTNNTRRTVQRMMGSHRIGSDGKARDTRTSQTEQQLRLRDMWRRHEAWRRVAFRELSVGTLERVTQHSRVEYTGRSSLPSLPTHSTPPTRHPHYFSPIQVFC